MTIDRQTATALFIPAKPEVQRLKDEREPQHTNAISDRERVYPDERSPGQKDYDRVLYSHAYLRLGGVTQILPPNASLPRLHNRLTHSLKVAQMARGIAQVLIAWAHRENRIEDIQTLGGLDAEVAAAAGLAHDLGHPPFGHAGESQLDRLSYQQKDRLVDTHSGFEGNAQTFRIAVKLEQSHTTHAGLRFTAGTRAAVLKYPWGRASSGFKARKFGYYEEDTAAFESARRWLGDPQKPGNRRDLERETRICAEEQTLEASVMDLADDISYAVHDLEDFLSLGVIRSSTVLFHCSNYINDDRKRYNPIQKLAEELERDYKSRFEDDLLKEACAKMLDQYLPHNESDPAHLREWRNESIEGFIDGIVFLDQPSGDKGARIDFNSETWHRVELFKFFAKKYVIRRRETALLQRAGNKVIENTLMALKDWKHENPEVSNLPIRLELAQIWMKELKDHIGRHYLDFICMLSNKELVDLHQALVGNKLPKAL